MTENSLQVYVLCLVIGLTGVRSAARAFFQVLFLTGFSFMSLYLVYMCEKLSFFFLLLLQTFCISLFFEVNEVYYLFLFSKII